MMERRHCSTGITTTIEVGLRDLGDFDIRTSRLANIVIFGPQGTEVIEIPLSDEVIVGRSRTADFCLDDPSLSRHHVRFGWKADDFFVEDLSSHNGTWIAGKKVTWTKLSSGDVVRLGNVQVIVAITDQPSQAVPKTQAPLRSAEGIVVINRKMHAIYQQVAQVAPIDASVLITGETGTGKEHVALSLHELSPRRNKPFKVVNCATIPAQITESILFGHEKGAFTGAVRRGIGLFEQADGGVLFFDEVGELPPAIQAGLLRAVETKTITRVGSTKEIKVDARIIAATHCDLESMVNDGKFRQDLLYRLNTITFEIPPLRERSDEIEPLADLFLRRASAAWNKAVNSIHPEAKAKLKEYSWPGNFRQLRNVVERGVVCSDTSQVTVKELPQYIIDKEPASEQSPAMFPESGDGKRLSYKERLRLWEIEAIRTAMYKCAGNQRAAARLLAIPRSTLSYKLETYDLAAKRWSREDREDCHSNNGKEG